MSELIESLIWLNFLLSIVIIIIVAFIWFEVMPEAEG